MDPIAAGPQKIRALDAVEEGVEDRVWWCLERAAAAEQKAADSPLLESQQMWKAAALAWRDAAEVLIHGARDGRPRHH
jgi:hypothetical protein